jgi:aspartyl/asparaginyl-tRNA synthetase
MYFKKLDHIFHKLKKRQVQVIFKIGNNIIHKLYDFFLKKVFIYKTVLLTRMGHFVLLIK